MTRRILAGGLVLWVGLAALYVARSPEEAFSHDSIDHVEHTRILYRTHRLADPRATRETYQPPLYYLINTLFHPDSRRHAFGIRLLSVLYGGLTLLVMSAALRRWGVTNSLQAILLSFIATTPAFLFMFTTYNNDALATLLSMLVLIESQKWGEEGRPRTLLRFGLLMTAGLYTKLSVIYPIAAIALVLGYLGAAQRLPWMRFISFAGVAAISVLLLAPWLVAHNYRLTGRFIPTPADTPVFEPLRLPHGPLKTLLTPPGVSPGEWKDPYAHFSESTNHKKNSFLSYLFVTSVFGQFTFEFLPPVIPWAIVSIQAIFWIAGLVAAWRIPRGRLPFTFIVLGMMSLATLILRAPYATMMDFRYIAWIWLPMAVLYGILLGAPNSLSALMVSGTALQTVLWLALVVGGRWNIP